MPKIKVNSANKNFIRSHSKWELYRFLDINITIGVKQLIDECDDIRKMIFSIRSNQKSIPIAERFQIWNLKRLEPEICHYSLICDNGKGKILFSEVIDIFDFKYDELKLYFFGEIVVFP